MFVGFGALGAGGLSVRYLIGALLGGLALQMILRVMDFEISLVAAVAAMFVGIVVAFALRTGFPEAPAFPVIPFVSSLGGIASVLSTTWIAQMSAVCTRREFPS